MTLGTWGKVGLEGVILVVVNHRGRLYAVARLGLLGAERDPRASQDHDTEESPGPPDEPRACEQSVGSAVAGTPGACFLKDSTGAWRVVHL